MANMSYCRFHNTLSDLRDCYEYMGDPEKLSDAERGERIRLIKLCVEIAADYEDELESTEAGIRIPAARQDVRCRQA